MPGHLRAHQLQGGDPKAGEEILKGILRDRQIPSCWFDRQGMSWNDPHRPCLLVSFEGTPGFIPTFAAYRTSKSTTSGQMKAIDLSLSFPIGGLEPVVEWRGPFSSLSHYQSCEKRDSEAADKDIDRLFLACGDFSVKPGRSTQVSRVPVGEQRILFHAKKPFGGTGPWSPCGSKGFIGCVFFQVGPRLRCSFWFPF